MRLAPFQLVGSASRQGIKVTFRHISTVLLVENEPLIALDLEGMLLALGASSVHHVVSSDEALAWLRDHRPELAILDIFVKDGPSTPVADQLRLQSIPFVVHSGHTRRGSGYGASFSEAVWLSKPCTEADLVVAIDQALGLPL
jgi:CheY-like chemotaxis protein